MANTKIIVNESEHDNAEMLFLRFFKMFCSLFFFQLIQYISTFITIFHRYLAMTIELQDFNILVLLVKISKRFKRMELLFVFFA